MKKFVALVLAFLMLTLAACSPQEEANEISYHVDSLPKTLDPQIATTHEELTVVLNTFEGLTKTDKNGNAVLAAAETYSVSADGLTYTFKIADGKKWSNGSTLTAHDFVFGITRSVNPNTKSSDKARLSVIKGAEEIMNNKQNTLNPLGVMALDIKTLQITLKAPCPQFLSYLSMPAFMPCNKEFFESTNGKYGLDTKNTIFNGAYYVNKWDASKNYISLRPSENYSGKTLCNFDTVMLLTNQGEKLVSEFNKGNINMVSANQVSDISQFTSATLHSEINTTCLLYINSEKVTPELISALRKTINVNSILESGNNFATKGVVPETAVSNGKNYRENSNVSFANVYDPETAHFEFINALKAPEYRGNFPKADIIYVSGKNNEAIAKKIAAGWQSDLGAFVNINGMDSVDLNATIRNGDFTFALVPITAGTKDAADYMMALANSPIRIGNEDFNRFIAEATHATNMNEHTLKLAQAEKIAIDTGFIIPICSTSENFVCSSSIYGNISYINGGFDFTRNQ